MTTAQRNHVRKLVAALRSGKYRQTTGTLAHQPEGKVTRYCCLGVACDLAVKAKKGEWSDHNRIDLLFIPANDLSNGNDKVIPTEFARDYYGFEEGDPYLRVTDDTKEELDKKNRQRISLPPLSMTEHASVLNDSNNWTFKQIADAFERTFLPADWKKTKAARAVKRKRRTLKPAAGKSKVTVKQAAAAARK